MNTARKEQAYRPAHQERVYVRVNSDFDPTGYMQPKSITWSDGRTFKIDAVKDFRPASVYRGGSGACYTVMIRGVEKHLYFEWTDSTFSNRIARWYVEAAPAETP